LLISAVEIVDIVYRCQFGLPYESTLLNLDNNNLQQKMINNHRHDNHGCIHGDS